MTYTQIKVLHSFAVSQSGRHLQMCVCTCTAQASTMDSLSRVKAVLVAVPTRYAHVSCCSLGSLNDSVTCGLQHGGLQHWIRIKLLHRFYSLLCQIAAKFTEEDWLMLTKRPTSLKTS